MTFYERVVEWSSWGWPLLVNHLWQATLFSLLVLALCLLLERAPARVRHWLLLIALIKFALPATVVTSIIGRMGIDIASLFTSENGGPASGLAISPLLSPVTSPPVILQAVEQTTNSAASSSIAYTLAIQDNNYLYIALTLCWAIGCALLLCSWLRRRSQLTAAIRAGKVLSKGREPEVLERVRSWLGLRRKATLVISPGITEPGVWRVLRPIVVLPEGVPNLLNDGELEAVMLHEMVHVERWDNLTGILQRVVCCVLWFHPLVWLLDRRLEAEREQSCDDTVIKLSGDSEVYAASIKKVCRYSIGWGMSGLSSAAGSNLKRRIKRIVAADVKRSPSMLHRALVGAVGAALILFSAATGLIRGGSAAAGMSSQASAVVDARFEVTTSEEAQGNQAVEAQETLPPPARPQEKRETAQQSINLPGIFVEVRAQPAQPAQAGQPENVSVVVQGGADVMPPPPAEIDAQPSTISAAIIPATATTRDDLRKFIGRYEVDPSRSENFVIDITLENGQLWLKPSHAAQRKLVRTTAMSFSDVYADYRFTCIQDDKGRVVGLRLDSWNDNVTARKLNLPAPSRQGNTTFRLKGYPNARIVAVAGTFNKWNQSQLLFAREGDEWVCRVNLPPGTYQYKFIIDGNWITDPGNNQLVDDGRGNTNSLLSAE
jgi:beta-lactamase regulating signal transducer with metallopeptidase domain